jgi:hypothetical protein
MTLIHQLHFVLLLETEMLVTTKVVDFSEIQSQSPQKERMTESSATFATLSFILTSLGKQVLGQGEPGPQVAIQNNVNAGALAEGSVKTEDSR